MVDLDQQALNGARPHRPQTSASALQRQNVILPSGDVKIGSKDYTLTMNNSPDVIASDQRLPGQGSRREDGVHARRRACARRLPGPDQLGAVDGTPGALMTIRKTGGVSTSPVIDGVRDALPYIKRIMPSTVKTSSALFDQSVFVKAALNSVKMGGLMAAGLTGADDPAVPGQLAADADHPRLDPAVDRHRRSHHVHVGGQTLNTMTLGGFALAVGILVDNGTVVIENIERHVREGEPLEHGDSSGRRRSRHHRPSSRRSASASSSFRSFSSREPRSICSRRCRSQSACRADREPCAVLHPGAGAVQVSDALHGRRAPRT
jgi:hypothetical protein